MRHMNWLVGGLMLGASLTACGDPPLSDVASEGGSLPDPGGLLEGAVQYVGPRPLCDYDENGNPTKLRGVGAVLILYGFDDLPPPNGPLPTSVLVVPMTEFFANLSDCMPQNPTPADLHHNVSVSAPYSWPRIPLGAGLDTRSYRIEAIFDRDGDYYPLLPLTHGIHTAGDAIGGATVGFGRDYKKITFGGLCDAEIGTSGRDNGQVVRGVGVTIALPLWTERQMFEVKQTNKRKYLSSEQTIDLGEGEWGEALLPPAFFQDAEGKLEASKAAYMRLRKFAGLELSLISPERAAPDCKDPENLKEDGSNKCVGPRLKRLGLEYDLLDHKSYAWHLYPRDGDGDGYADFHPPLSFAFGPYPEAVEDPTAKGFAFSLQTPWTFPFVALSRIKTEEEKLAGVPDAGMLGGVDKFAQDEHSVYFPDLPVSLVPTVAISTKKIDANGDGLNDCDVDVYPPGNFNVAYEVEGRYSDCQELPVGDYSIVTITGVAGNVVYKEDPRSQTGWNLALPDEDKDGEADPFAVAGVGQIWLHPNDLGDVTKYTDGFKDDPKDPNDGTAVEQANDFALQTQSQAAAFKIRDPNGKNEVRPFIDDALQEPMMGADGMNAAIGDCDVAIKPNPPLDVEKIKYPEIPDSCCSEETVALCDLPRCEVIEGGNLAPTTLRAWVSTKKVSAGDFNTKEDLMALETRALTLAEAKDLTDKGGTVFFIGRFVEVPASEAADIVLPRADFDPKDRQYITYEELYAEDTTVTKAAYPNCEELRKAAGKPDDGKEPEVPDTVRLKLVQLEPTCVPFLIPMGCCKG